MTPKTMMMILRLVQIGLGLAFASALVMILVTIANHESIKVPAGVPVLLTIGIITVIHVIVAFVFILLRRTLYITAIGDILSLGAMITAAVLTRPVAMAFDCHGLLASKPSPNVDADATLMRRADSPVLTPNPQVCGTLTGVFGLSVVGCILFIVAFQALLLTIRKQKQIAVETRGQVEAYWREGAMHDTSLHRSHVPPNLNGLDRRDSSESEDSDISEMKAFENVPLPLTPKPTLASKESPLPPR